MRTLMIVRDYFPTVGGVPTHARALVHGLAKLGVQTEVLVGGSDARTALLPVRSGARISDYDIVHVQGGPFGALIGHPSLIVTVHSPILEEGRYFRPEQRLKVPFAYLLERTAIARASALISVSRQTASCLTRDYRIDSGKISVIPNGVDCESFRPRVRSVREIPRILLCARLEPRKNMRQAVLALRGIKDVPFSLEVVGDGSERESLEELARGIPNHRFDGAVPEDNLNKIFAESDAFVSTSLSEGFGLTVLEAMASGCAVLVSDIPVHREIVTHGVNGLLFKDDVDLNKQLRNLLKDPDLRARLGRKARQFAVGCNWDVVAAKTLELYRKAVGSNGAGEREA